LQVLKCLADPDHYFSKFTTGNSSTLPTSDPAELQAVRDALLAFHRKHYRPENLTVVLAGPQPLDQLQEWMVPRFSNMVAAPFPKNESEMTDTERMIHVAAADAPAYTFAQAAPAFKSAFVPSLQDNQWPVLLTTKPVQSMRRLVLMFPLPSVHKDSDQSPTSVLSHLLGHEGPESSFAVLQNAGLVSSLSAGPRVTAPDFTLFQIDIGLTEQGEVQWKQVVDIILQHCRLIHEASLQGTELVRIWDEMSAISRMFFDQTSPGGVYGLAPSLSNSVAINGTVKCLSAGSRLDETTATFPLQRVQEFSALLVPSNCFIERCSSSAWEEMEAPDNKTSSVQRKTEPWYGIDYFLSGIDAQDVERWQHKPGTTPFLETSSLGLPPPNQFIPRTMELCPDLPQEAKAGPRIEKEVDPPNLLVEDKNVGRLWHRLDDRYALPKSIVTLLIRNAATDHVKIDDTWHYSVEASVQSALLTAIFAEALAQETYDADLAGLNWSLSTSSAGVRISCSGFSDRLPDLALKVLHDFFLSGQFLQESFFVSTQDRLLRNLRTFFESRRADSHAMYYRELLLVNEDLGLDAQLAAAESATLDSVKKHHKALLQNDETSLECLFSGNVSEAQAKDFFASASKLHMDSQSVNAVPDTERKVWIPGTAERRLLPGDDIELHFASKNPQEENGAVLFTYQSTIPSFRGEGLSPPESLESSAAIRLLCHIMREPLFNDLRTKQQLGYIVSSYHDMGFSSRPAHMVSLGALSIPVDFIVISVLSRKVAPPEVARRIDDFLADFRSSLENMPESEIHHHATALSTKMLKPVQKLGSEASSQFAKIRRYSPELLDNNGGTGKDIPWDSVKALAKTIESLERQELLLLWDRMVQPHSRARVVSCVYGTTFPLQPSEIPVRTGTVVDSIPSIIELRKKLVAFDNTAVRPPAAISKRLFRWAASNRTALGFAAATVVMAGATGWTILSRSKKRK
jgi:insulysin